MNNVMKYEDFLNEGITTRRNIEGITIKISRDSDFAKYLTEYGIMDFRSEDDYLFTVKHLHSNNTYFMDNDEFDEYDIKDTRTIIDDSYVWIGRKEDVGDYYDSLIIKLKYKDGRNRDSVKYINYKMGRVLDPNGNFFVVDLFYNSLKAKDKIRKFPEGRLDSETGDRGVLQTYALSLVNRNNQQIFLITKTKTEIEKTGVIETAVLGTDWEVIWTMCWNRHIIQRGRPLETMEQFQDQRVKDVCSKSLKDVTYNKHLGQNNLIYFKICDSLVNKVLAFHNELDGLYMFHVGSGNRNFDRFESQIEETRKTFNPKTDIYLGRNPKQYAYKISLKKSKSQIISSGQREIEFILRKVINKLYEVPAEKRRMDRIIDRIVNTARWFSEKKMFAEVNTIKNNFFTSRFFRYKKWEEHTDREKSQVLDRYLNTIPAEQRDITKDIVNSYMQNKALTSELDEFFFNNRDIKKEVIRECLTGNLKYGDPDGVTIATADHLLIFDDAIESEPLFHAIDDTLLETLMDDNILTFNVSFKTSGGYSHTVMRGQIKEFLKNIIMRMEQGYDDDDMDDEYLDEGIMMFEEFNLMGGLKKIGSKIKDTFNYFVDKIKGFFNSAIKTSIYNGDYDVKVIIDESKNKA